MFVLCMYTWFYVLFYGVLVVLCLFYINMTCCPPFVREKLTRCGAPGMASLSHARANMIKLLIIYLNCLIFITY